MNEPNTSVEKYKMWTRAQSTLNHFSRSNTGREQMEIRQKVVEQELEMNYERCKSRAHTIISRHRHEHEMS